MSTLRIQLTFTNNTADPQHFRMRDPVSCVQRLRVFCAGTLVEDIHACNRVNEMMRILSPPGSNANDAVEGFGTNVSALDAPNADNMFILTVGKSITVSLRLNRVSGLLSCGKDLPLRFCPVTLELEFADGHLFMNQNPNYTITNACARHSFLVLDSSLDSEFVSRLLSNKQLLLSFNAFSTLYQTLPQTPDCAISIQRAFTRLNKMYCIFGTSAEDKVDTMMYPRLYLGSAFPSDDQCYSWQVSCGARNFPERRVETLDEQWAQLSEATGRDKSGKILPYSISGIDFVGTKHVLGVNFMRTPMFGSGISTRAGDVIRLSLYNKTPAIDVTHVILQSDCMLSISEAGCQVMD